jgi:DNA invertase Pin-like site-specific DNA recombinase
MNALIYTRVSKDSRDGRSVAEQETECRRVCEANGWTIAAVLSDNDRSASRHAKRSRPAWTAVKKRVTEGDIDVLCVWESSRSTRDLGEYVALRDLCRAHGVRLSYSGRVLDFEDTRDSFQAGLDALLAEDEAERTRSRILRSTRAQAEAGRPHGRRLYGYRRVYDPTTRALVGQEPHPDEAPIVQEIARRAASGESLYAITEDLNARQVPVPTGAEWSQTRIKRTLQNPAYVGKRVHRGEIVGEADWPPLLDEALFRSIGQKLSDPERQKYRGGRDLVHLLSGIARCGICGAALYVGGDRGRPVYICRRGKGHLTRSKEHLDAYIVSLVIRRLATLDLDDLDGEPSEQREARVEARKLKKRLDDATDKFTEGKLSASTLARIERQLAPKIAEAERAATPRAVSPLLSELASANAAQRWDALTIEQQREAVRELADIMVLRDTRGRGKRGLDPDAVRVDWKF